MEYLVDWASLGSESFEPTWEPEQNFIDHKLTSAFNRQQQQQQRLGSWHHERTRDSRSCSRSTSPPRAECRHSTRHSRAERVEGTRLQRQPAKQQEDASEKKEEGKEPLSWSSPMRWMGEIAAGLCYALNFAQFLSTLTFSADIPLATGARLAHLLSLPSWIAAYLLGTTNLTVDGNQRMPTTREAAEVCEGHHPTDWATVTRPLLLFLLFSLQHSIMGRLRVQKTLSNLLGKGGERVAFLLASCVAVQGLMAAWRPLPCVAVWQLPSVMHPTHGTAHSPLSAIALGVGSLLDVLFLLSAGWMMLALGQIAYFDLFRYRQSFVGGLQLPTVPQMKPQPPLVYRVTRQPLFSALLGCMWATSQMVRNTERTPAG